MVTSGQDTICQITVRFVSHGTCLYSALKIMLNKSGRWESKKSSWPFTKQYNDLTCSRFENNLWICSRGDILKKVKSWCNATHLIKEEPQLSLCLTNPLAQTVSTFAHKEGHSLCATTALIGQGTCDQRLPSACKTRHRSVKAWQRRPPCQLGKSWPKQSEKVNRPCLNTSWKWNQH